VPNVPEFLITWAGVLSSLVLLTSPEDRLASLDDSPNQV